MELWFLFFLFFCLIKFMYEDNLLSLDNFEIMVLILEVGCRRVEIVGIYLFIYSVYIVLMLGFLYLLFVYFVKEEQNYLILYYKLLFLFVTILKFLNKIVNIVVIVYNIVFVQQILVLYKQFIVQSFCKKNYSDFCFCIDIYFLLIESGLFFFNGDCKQYIYMYSLQ